jgi:hypothetical protein
VVHCHYAIFPFFRKEKGKAFFFILSSFSFPFYFQKKKKITQISSCLATEKQ